MFELQNIKALVFDYGATIDTNGLHWAEVIWKAYEALRLPVSKEDFRSAYVHGERKLAGERIVLPRHNFWHVLRFKAEAQIRFLQSNGLLEHTASTEAYATKISDWCYSYAQIYTNFARPTLKKLSETRPLILVTNFYGNISTVLDDFYLKDLFALVVESATEGVRKPDPEIFRIALERTGLKAEETVVIGDSYDKDIAPAAAIGCRTVWLRNIGWTEPSGDERADAIISTFDELLALFSF